MVSLSDTVKSEREITFLITFVEVRTKSDIRKTLKIVNN